MSTSAHRERDLSALEDSALMGRLGGGHVEALTELYDRYAQRAYRVAVAVCRDEYRAQDAVQDAFLSIWMSRGSYRRQRGTVAAWLLSVVRHRAIDAARRNGRHDARRVGENQLEVNTTGGDVAEIVVRHEEAARVHAALALLPDPQQEVIVLAYYGQLTHSEIAAELDLPSGTVKGRMRLGLKRLQSSLERSGA